MDSSNSNIVQYKINLYVVYLQIASIVTFTEETQSNLE